YGFTVPLVSLYYNNPWQIEAKRIIRKVCRKQQNDAGRVGVKSTFGEEMMVEGTEYSKRYFDMLRRNWS
ncbi:hypothetical protein TELCIR_13494, partial [Teladorsagia circumcincta]